MFKSKYGAREICTSEPGSGTKVSKYGKLDNKGTVKVIDKGVENVYDYIQSFADSVDLNVLIGRFNRGDTNALNQVEGMYIDATVLPKSYRESLDMVNNVSLFFDKLPAEVKSLYNNNLYEFVSDIGSERFDKLFSAPAEEVAVVEEPVKAVVDDAVLGK